MTESPTTTNENDPILTKAHELLSTGTTPIERDRAFNILASLIANLDSIVSAEDYTNTISSEFDIAPRVFRKLIKLKQDDRKRELELKEKQRLEAEELQEQQRQLLEEQENQKVNSIEEYFLKHKIDGVVWKADQLLSNITNPKTRNDKFEELAHMIALIDKPVARDDYAVRIGRKYDLQPSTFKKMIADALEVRKRQREIRKKARKNEVISLRGSANTYPFFDEVTNKDGSLQKIIINKVKFRELLSSFGFSRFEVSDNDNYTFVRVLGNIIASVTPDDIIDVVEDFITKEYDFDKAGAQFVDAEMLINKFYDGINNLFNKKLFARVRLTNPIIISRDKLDTTYLYYSNGFLEITKDEYNLRPYDEMEGSVWNHQMLPREYKAIEPDEIKKGDFFNFCWLVSGEKEERFHSLCSLIGYLMHDFYDYKLKAILFTDSTISDTPMGRTGKGMIFDMIALVRSLCDIDGKEYNPNDKHKFEDLKIGTQVVHFNDIKHRGANAFDFENLFNAIIKGLKVNIKYVEPFMQKSKIGISTNKMLNINGDSQEDRIVEFEVAPFFSKNYTPQMHFKRWFGRDWDDLEWNRFDNFMAVCASLFHQKGIIAPPTINLEQRRLRDYCGIEFIEFMEDIEVQLKNTGVPWAGYVATQQTDFKKFEMHEFAFDKAILFNRFILEYPDFKSKSYTLSQKRFTSFLVHYSKVKMNVPKPKQYKSNGSQFIQFILED